MRLSVFCAIFVLTGSLVTANFALAADFDDPPSELALVLVRKAKLAEKKGDLADAYVYYSQASALQPRNRGYRTAAAALQSRGAAQIKAATPAPVVTPVQAPATDAEEHHAAPPAGSSNPGLFLDNLTARELARSPQLSSPPQLNADAGHYDFDLNDTPRGLFDKVAGRFNLQIVYDSDYPAGGQPMRFRITTAGYREALEALEAATGSFVIPLAPRVIMVAHDTAAKRNDLEQFMTLSVPIPQVITTQELTEIVQLVRQVSSVEKIGWDTNRDQIVMRDRVSRVALAQALLEQLFTYHPEVMIDLELLQVSGSDLVNYGFNVTNSFPLVYLGGIQNSLASIPSGVANLLTFGGGRTLIGVAAAQVQAMFNETFSNSKSLYSARLRSASGEAATFHEGEKYPIITSGFVAASTTNTTGSTVPSYAAPPAVSFENLGLELKATPHVHGASAVSMSIEASYEVLSGQSADGIPVISTNKITTDIRLRDEEWAVVAGLISDSKTKTKGGFWGLANIPWIGNLFRQTSIDKESNTLLIGIRPHILYIGPDENVTRPLRAGTDQRPYLPI